MEYTRSEDCLILFGLTPEFSKVRLVYKALEEFMKNKQSIDPSDRFNLILFQDKGPKYLDQFTFEASNILDTYRSLSSKIIKANLAGGIFIATTFIIDVFKTISEKVFRLIILTDDEAHKIPSQYVPALEDLIRKVKDMPFFIDVIRIGKKDPEERDKLLKLTKICNGEFYEIDSIREIKPPLILLSEKKRIKEAMAVTQKIRVVLTINQPFYENLADDPPILDKIGTCSICFKKDDNGIVKCPSCETLAHKVCWAQWAKTSNIGIPHVFRCHTCFNILRLDREFVLNVREGRIPTIAEMEKVKKKNIVEYLRELEAKRSPQIIQTEDPFAADVRAMIDTKKVEPQEEISKKRKKKKTLVQICPNCSKLIMGERKLCPSCGFTLF